METEWSQDYAQCDPLGIESRFVPLPAHEPAWKNPRRRLWSYAAAEKPFHWRRLGPRNVTISAAIHHIYKYDRPVVLEPQIVRLRPAPHCRTKISAYSLKVL
jgi:Bacterial transglutaminase-like N-terminal region